MNMFLYNYVESERPLMKFEFIENILVTKVNNENICHHYLWSFAPYRVTCGCPHKRNFVPISHIFNLAEALIC